MVEEQLAQLLRLTGENDGWSTALAAHRLKLGQSELLRLLAVLGDDTNLGGLGLIVIESDAQRTRLRLTEKGHQWLRGQP